MTKMDRIATNKISVSKIILLTALFGFKGNDNDYDKKVSPRNRHRRKCSRQYVITRRYQNTFDVIWISGLSPALSPLISRPIYRRIERKEAS